MSIASIVNGSLQLSDLIISNEKYSNSAGYQPSTASFAASLTGTSIFVPEITTDKVTLNSLTDDTSYSVNSYSDIIAITAGSATTTPAILLTNSVNSIELSCPSTGVLQIGNQLRIVETGSNNYVNVNCVGQGEANVETLVLGANTDQVTLESPSTGVLQISGGNLRIVESGSTNYVNVNCTGLGEANVESLLIGTTSPDTNVLLQCTTSNELSVSGLAVGGNTTIGNSLTVGPNIVEGVDYSYLSATHYTGGLGRFQGSLNFGTIGPGAKYFFPEVTIPNFVGTATSSYVISSNYTDSGVINPLIWSVEFVSADTETTSTIVSVEVYNTLTSNSILGPNNVSIIAMN